MEVFSDLTFITNLPDRFEFLLLGTGGRQDACPSREEAHRVLGEPIHSHRQGAILYQKTCWCDACLFTCLSSHQGDATAKDGLQKYHHMFKVALGTNVEQRGSLMTYLTRSNVQKK